MVYVNIMITFGKCKVSIYLPRRPSFAFRKYHDTGTVGLIGSSNIIFGLFPKSLQVGQSQYLSPDPQYPDGPQQLYPGSSGSHTG